MSIGEVFKEGREVRTAFRKMRQDVIAARPGGVTPAEAAVIAADFAELAGEVADLIGVVAKDKDELIVLLKKLLTVAGA